MAEFQEVMRQMFRLHKACGVECLMDDGNQCPLFAIECAPCGWLHGGTEYQVKQMEEAVMDWASEHPEPVYETWFDWLEQNGVTGRAYELEPYFSGDKEIYLRTAALTPKAFEPIPADIAQKLGLQPKEG